MKINPTTPKRKPLAPMTPSQQKSLYDSIWHKVDGVNYEYEDGGDERKIYFPALGFDLVLVSNMDAVFEGPEDDRWPVKENSWYSYIYLHQPKGDNHYFYLQNPKNFWWLVDMVKPLGLIREAILPARPKNLNQ